MRAAPRTGELSRKPLKGKIPAESGDQRRNAQLEGLLAGDGALHRLEVAVAVENRSPLPVQGVAEISPGVDLGPCERYNMTAGR